MSPEDPSWKELDQKIDDHHLARCVRRQLSQLDTTSLIDLYPTGGKEPYEPVAMLSMVLYLILKGIASPARWHEEAVFNESVRWLGYGYQPSRRTWYDFRDRMAECIDSLHATLVRRAVEQKLADPTTGVQDGTSIAACASRHRMVNDSTLAKRRELLQRLIDGSAQEGQSVPMWVPPTEAGRLDLARRMDRAREVLEQRIAENAVKPSEKRKDPGKILVSLSDPDAPFGRDKLKVFRPLYTVQYVVDPTSLLILGYQCEAAVCDTGTLAPMIDRVQKIVDGALRCMLADAAYCTILDLRACQQRNIELLAPVQCNSLSQPKQSTNGVGVSNRDQFIWDQHAGTYQCPAGHRLNYHSQQKKRRHGGQTLVQYRYHCPGKLCSVCSMSDGCVKNPSSGRTVTRMEGQELLDAQQEKMAEEETKQRYQVRSQTVERSFGDAKGNRRYDRYHGRGLRRARCETGLLVLAQNVLRLDRLERNARNPAKTTT